jgi:hypothetical protein
LWEEIALVGDSLWIIGSYWADSRPKHALMLRTPVSALLSPAPIPWTFYEYPQFRGFMEISVVSPTLVWISGGGWNDTISSPQASLVHTTDGGRTFLNDAHKVPTGTSLITEIAFADSVHGWLGIGSAPSNSYATTNGGLSWFLQTTWEGPPRFQPIDSSLVYAGNTLYFPTPRVTIWRSTNGGSSWAVLDTGTADGGAVNFFKVDNEHMWLLGGSSIWYYQHVPPPQIQPIPDTTIVLDSVWTYQVQAAGTGLRYRVTAGPSWLGIDSLSGLLAGTPTSVGSWPVTIEVRDTVWQVAAVMFRLTVAPPVPGTPSLLLPANGAVGVSTSPILRWSTVPYANMYHLQFGDDSVFAIPPATIVVDTLVSDTSFALSNLQNNRRYYWRVRSHNLSGYSPWSEMFNFTTSATGVTELPGVPSEFWLGQNYPNPFNPSTHIRFSVRGSGFEESGSGFTVQGSRLVTLKVYDVLGREVAKLVNENLLPGRYEVTFDAEGLASGVYLYRLRAGEFTQTKRMVLMR